MICNAFILQAITKGTYASEECRHRPTEASIENLVKFSNTLKALLTTIIQADLIFTGINSLTTNLPHGVRG